MTKIEEVKVDTLDNISQPKSTEKIATIYPETIELPNYQYGNGQNTIDGNIAIRNLPTGGSKTLYFEFSSGTALGIQNYTGFGFKPSAYIIQAWYKGNIAGTSTSYCTYFNGSVGGYYQYPDFQNENTLRAININNRGATLSTKANFSSFLSDGIALDFVNNSNTIGFTITAFK